MPDAFFHSFGILHAGITFQHSWGRLLLGPLDRMKLLTQTQYNTFGQSRTKFYTLREIMATAKIVKNTQGFASFWRGATAGFAGGILGGYVADILTKIFSPFLKRRHFKKLSFKEKFFQLAMYITTENIGQAIFYPLEYLSIRLASDIGKGFLERKYKGILDCCNHSYKEGGWAIFYTGFKQKMQFNLLFPTLALLMYDTINRYLFSRRTPYFIQMATAQVTFVLAYMMSYPLLVIKNNLIVQAGRPTWWRLLWTDRSPRECRARLVKEAGMRALFAGLAMDLFCGAFAGQFALFYGYQSRYN